MTAIADLPPTLSMAEACELLGCSTDTGYEMVRAGTFPSRVLRLGRKIRIPTAPLLDILGVAP